MKLVTNLLAVICLTMSGVAWAQKADGYAWEPNDNFRPEFTRPQLMRKFISTLTKKRLRRALS